MMLKEKSSPWARLKYLYVLPLAAIAVTAFARPEISNELEEISKVKVNDLTAIVEVNEVEKQIVEPQIEPEPVVVERREVSQKPIQQQVVVNEKKVETEEQDVTEVMELTGVQSFQASKAEARFDATKPEVSDNTTLEVSLAENRVNVAGGNMLLRAANIKMSKPQTVKIHGIKDGKEPLFIVNGKEVNYSIVRALNPSSIESMEVLKDMDSTRIYGERGENGVVIITLKGEEEIAKEQSPTGNFIGDAKTHIKGNPIVLFDGKEIDSIESVDPSTIKSVHVLKDISGANEDEVKLFTKYGEKSENGFILIKSKSPSDKTDVQLLSVQRSKNISVDGLVTDEVGKPVVGASVLISGTNIGTITNMDGKFQIKAADNATLVISYIDMESAKVQVAPNVTVKLKSE